MEAKRLMKVTYQDLIKGIRLNAYADAVIWSEDPSPTLAGLRFGGYTSTLTPLQQRIAELRDIGYSVREFSAICGIPYIVVALEMEGAKRSILEVYIGDAPRAA